MSDVNIELATDTKIPAYPVLVLLIALLFGTFLRVSLLLIYPVLVFFLFWAFKWKLERNAVYLLVIMAISWLISLRHGFFLSYNLVSFYFYIPFILLLLAIPPKESQGNYFVMLMQALSIVMVLNNVIGFVQYIGRPNDDSFSGIYGTFTVSQNGLVILNSILFYYHFTVFQERRKLSYFILSMFFLISLVMGFYGAGLMVLLFTLVLTHLKLRVKNILLITLSLLFAVSTVALLMQLISPATLEYNVNIIKKFLHSNEGIDVPRKLIIFKNYVAGYSSNIMDFIFGSGPGTFNSRSAFMVGSPTYFNLEIIKSSVQPYYFSHYAYTLWNDAIITRYDGFMNQPFTAILGLLGEYGLMFTLALMYVLIRHFNFFVTVGNRLAKQHMVSVEFKMYKFVSIYTFLLIMIDNFVEYPEIIGLMLIIVKLSQQQLRKAIDF